jgi:hypothetical protein
MERRSNMLAQGFSKIPRFVKLPSDKLKRLGLQHLVVLLLARKVEPLEIVGDVCIGEDGPSLF